MVGELNAQNVSNILWAVSNVEHRLTPRALRTFVSAFLNNIGNASFLSVAGTLASYKKIDGSQADHPLIARSIPRVRIKGACKFPGLFSPIVEGIQA